jgi:hypothetical protein
LRKQVIKAKPFNAEPVRFTSSQVNRFSGSQVLRFSGSQVHRFTGSQVLWFTGSLVYRFTGVQVYFKYMAETNKSPIQARFGLFQALYHRLGITINPKSIKSVSFAYS